MSFTYTGGANATGDSTAFTITHGLTINSGDLVVLYINCNTTDTVTADESGWTKFEEIPSTETARQQLYWKKAGVSEPSSYNFTSGTATEYQILIKVFSYTDSDVVVDAALEFDQRTSNSSGITVGENLSVSISAGAVSLAFGGKDNRNPAEAYTTANNSYVSVIGTTANQAAAGAHRIYVSSDTFTGINIDTADSSDAMIDKSHSCHISFIEDAGAPATVDNLPFGTQNLSRQFGANAAARLGGVIQS